MDEFRDIILDALGKSPSDWSGFVPSKVMTIGEWQEAIGRLEEAIRDDFENPDFALTTGAVRSCYNRSLDELARLVDHQLRLDESDDTVIAL